MARKLCLEVYDIKRNTQLHSNTPGIGNIIQGATGFVVCRSGFWPIPELHGDTNHLVALCLQEGSRHRTIYATTHSNHNALRRVPCAHALPRFPSSPAPLRQHVETSPYRRRAAYRHSVGSATATVLAL